MDVDRQLERIMEAKNAQGLTNQQFADLVGINKSTVYRIFGGKVTPDTETIRLMEVAMGICDTPRWSRRSSTKRKATPSATC